MPGLNGLKVLVVEDDPLMGLLIEDYLSDAGCEISGPHATITAAIQAAATEQIDLGVLDVNIAGRLSYPVGEVLSARHIPFILTSRFGADASPPKHREWPVCPKPFGAKDLTSALTALLAA